MADEPKQGEYTPEEMNRYFNDPKYRKQMSRKKFNFGLSPQMRIWIGAGVVVLGLSIWYWAYLVGGLPSLERIENPRPELATKVFSTDGEVLDQFFIKNRSHLSLADIPKPVVDALIATEDKDFYRHWGVDLVRFGKAMIKNVFALRLKEGASTITQQLSRNLYLGHSDRDVFDTISRKIREFMTAVQLEQTFTKDEIIEFYLNVVYFGRGAYGIASASQAYFGKAPADLTLGEVATLIAVLKGPGYYDPTGRHPERAMNRRNTVLSQMLKYDYITEQQAEEAKAEPIQPRPQDELAPAGLAPHFVEYIRQQLMQKAEKYGFDIYRDGISVYTTLDSRMQRYANRAVEEHLAEYQKLFDREWSWGSDRDVLVRVIDFAIKTSPQYRRATNAGGRDSVYTALRANRAWADSMKKIAQTIETGFVAVDPKSGGILAMVGGTSFRSFKYGLNHVTQIRRQVGSAFKPFVYTVAIDNGYPPCFELLNQPVTIMLADGKQWRPSNSDGEFGGKASIREAIKKSINLVAVRAIMDIAPVNQVIDYAHRMGITSPLPPYESLALGSGDISPLEMASAFGVYPNHGVYVEPISILKIEDKDGNTIEENFPMQREVLSEETAFIMTSMLQGVVNGGTGSHVRDYFQLPAAGKTGTTTDFADAWFVGYTPQISAAVWVGFDNKTVHFKTWDGQGGRAAAPIWGRFMKYVYDDPGIAMPLQYFEKPAKVYEETICVETKKLATEYCPNRMSEYFTEKTRPGKCNKHTSSKWREGEEGMGTILGGRASVSKIPPKAGPVEVGRASVPVLLGDQSALSSLSKMSLESPLSGRYSFSAGFFFPMMISGIAASAMSAATFQNLPIKSPVELRRELQPLDELYKTAGYGAVIYSTFPACFQPGEGVHYLVVSEVCGMQQQTDDKYFESYKAKVYEKLTEADRTVIPSTWWETVIKHYYNNGYSEERTVRAIQETMNK